MQVDAGWLGPGSGKDIAQGGEELLQAFRVDGQGDVHEQRYAGLADRAETGLPCPEAVGSPGSVIFFSPSQGCLGASLARGGMSGHHPV
jgi:hypothetical protein